MLKRMAGIGFVLLLAGSAPLLWKGSREAGILIGFFPDFAQSNQGPAAGADGPAAWEHRPMTDTQDLNDALVALSTRSKQDQTKEQQARLRADMARLAVLETHDPALAKALYGDDWQTQVEAHRREGERAEFLFTLSIVLTALGGILFGWCILLGGTRLLIRLARCIARKLRPQRTGGKVASPEQEASAAVQTAATSTDGVSESGDTADPLSSDSSDPKSRPLATFQWGPRFLVSKENEETLPYRRIVNPLQDHCLGNMVESVSSRFLAHGPSVPPPGVAQNSATQTLPILLDSDDEEGMDEFSHWEESLKSQAAAVEKQMAEVKEVAQRVRDSAAEGSEPVNQALLSLNDQISAIREFASDQQDRVEKLQNGYDWTIIRTFCLRIIRCIDNIELQMMSASGAIDEDHPFAQIRDELLFALESSGVEQFEPKVKSLFQGQERRAEAVKEKQSTKNRALKGCIARIIKPGYQYILDEETQRVVRTARVKLYGG
ncbi:MAG: hypothetical protein IIC50_21455 [Planctomycetes bacterium]|nr:hypothetical protein [Planctomycetota bacterium]